MKRFFKLIFMLVIGSVFIMGSFQPTIAQEDEGFTLEEVVVTAQKREQAAMDVPVALSVIDSAGMENYDINTFRELDRLVPSLTFNDPPNPAYGIVSIRGVGTSVFSFTAPASVTTLVDEVPLIRQTQAFNDLEDIKRVEVLRGPQGTLFGKNSTAGLISIVTKEPSEKFTATIRAGITDDDEKKGSVSLSGPLSETLGYRVSAYYKDREGYITNLYDGSDKNGEESKGIRAKLSWQPSDNFDATMIFDKSSQEGGNTATFFEVSPWVTDGTGITAGPDNLYINQDTPDTFESDSDLYVFKFNYDFARHTLTSITSYQNWDIDYIQDMDEGLAQINPFNPFLNPLGMTGPEVVQSSHEGVTAFSQELRLVSTESEKFEYLLGLFYSNADNERSFLRVPLRFVLSNWDSEAGTDSYAVFGQGALSVSSKTFVDIGVRAMREEISVSFTDFFGNGFVLDDPGITYKGEDSENAITGKLALRHFLENDAMVYGSVSTGYKGITYDVTTGFDQTKADNPVGSETSVSYEVGIKGFSENKRFRYELAAFLTDFKDFQQQSARLDEFGTPIFKLNNVGELRSKGVEADLVYQATDSLRLNGSLAYTDAMIESFKNANCYSGQTEAQGCIDGLQDLSGKPLNNSPDWKYTLGANWEQVSTSWPFKLFAQANYQWQDDVNYSLLAEPLNSQDAYGTANVSFGVIEKSGRYKVTFFVNNLFDKDFSLGYSDTGNYLNPPGTRISKTWTRRAMRYMGVNVTFRF